MQVRQTGCDFQQLDMDKKLSNVCLRLSRYITHEFHAIGFSLLSKISVDVAVRVPRRNKRDGRKEREAHQGGDVPVIELHPNGNLLL